MKEELNGTESTGFVIIGDAVGNDEVAVGCCRRSIDDEAVLSPGLDVTDRPRLYVTLDEDEVEDCTGHDDRSANAEEPSPLLDRLLSIRTLSCLSDSRLTHVSGHGGHDGRSRESTDG